MISVASQLLSRPAGPSLAVSGAAHAQAPTHLVDLQVQGWRCQEPRGLVVLPVASTQLARAPAAPDGGLLARTSLLYVRAVCTGQQPGMRMRGALVAALQAQGMHRPRGRTRVDAEASFALN